MKMDKTPKITQKLINKMMQHALDIDMACKEHCRDFSIMASGEHKNTLILRWCTIDIGDADRPLQHYRYECFDLNSNPQGCSIHYSNQEEANRFFEGLVLLYTQEHSQ